MKSQATFEILLQCFLLEIHYISLEKTSNQLALAFYKFDKSLIRWAYEIGSNFYFVHLGFIGLNEYEITGLLCPQ